VPAGDHEATRKWLHLAPLALAFTVRDLGAVGAVALTTALLGFNLWLLPRLGGGVLWRRGERARGAAPGILLYPAALLVLAVAAHARLEVLAGAWGMLACGDAAATLAGRRWGRARLPWNPAKTWLGWLAFVAAAWPAVAVLVLWTAGATAATVATVLAAGAASVAAATLESLTWRMDDNLAVTVLGGAVLWVALEVAGPWSLPGGPVPGWIVAALALAWLARALRVLDRAGAAAAVLVALAVGFGGGLPALGVLAGFVALGVLAGWLRRARRGGAPQPPRGLRHVLANGAVAAGCGLVAGGLEGVARAVPLAALVAALAAAAGDTVGGEVGQAVGGRTRRVTDGRAVEPGVDGGVSLAGTATTALVAAGVAVFAAGNGLVSPVVALAVAAAGCGGAILDSVLGATLERHGLLDNEGVNLLSTLAAAWVAAQCVPGP
jgi:uncharacterized protein (TIGR00297 family)